jgi:hypothetical protein
VLGCPSLTLVSLICNCPWLARVYKGIRFVGKMEGAGPHHTEIPSGERLDHWWSGRLTEDLLLVGLIDF